MSIKVIVQSPVKKQELIEIAKNQFGDLVNAVVDVENKVIAIGGELHSDEEAVLIENGSEQKNVWGINLYPEKKEDWIEFDSMINLRPSQGNLSRDIEDSEARKKIAEKINELII